MQPFWKTILLLLAVPVISFFVATSVALFGPIDAVEEGLTAELNRLIRGNGLVPEAAATAEA